MIGGPYIEYDCTKCGATVQTKVVMSRKPVEELIDSLKENPHLRVCASCGTSNLAEQKREETGDLTWEIDVTDGGMLVARAGDKAYTIRRAGSFYYLAVYTHEDPDGSNIMRSQMVAALKSTADQHNKTGAY